MHSHDHSDLDAESLRPRGARPEARADSALFQAASAGRPDVLGPQGMLRMQRAVGNAGTSALAEEERSPVLDVISGGGRPLDEPVRADMEGRLGTDFSDVRVHTDERAHASAQSVNAHAYTVGPNVVFQRDKYDPTSTGGATMLAHELTHVVQQRSGPVDGTPAGGGVRVSDPSDRFEREAAANAERVMSTPEPAAPVTAAGSVAAAVQRQEAAPEEEEDVQGAFVQRDVAQRDEEEEEEPA
ncbi:MAG: hypothetical protein DLM58_24205 [Pseudonocardiales bacterium]|nr:MAG: hypothetical protein DLM58_24205 [Pseudonocardiales bacterium]